MTSAGVPKYTLGGSDTVTVSVPVIKGQGVETDPDNPGKVRPWSANSTTRQGVAKTDGVPPASNGPDNFAPKRQHIAVAKAPEVQRMVFAAAAKKGDPLVAAAGGRVTKDLSATGLTLVGYCQGSDNSLDPISVEAGAVGHVELK
jgi:hypothetical protein